MCLPEEPRGAGVKPGGLRTGSGREAAPERPRRPPG